MNGVKKGNNNYSEIKKNLRLKFSTKRNSRVRKKYILAFKKYKY